VHVFLRGWGGLVSWFRQFSWNLLQGYERSSHFYSDYIGKFWIY